MFKDTSTIFIQAGNGGNGAVTFHREKYVAAGGPDGGDGGKGGNVVAVADKNVSTLLDFKYKKKYIAENGGNGMDSRRSGKNGEDLVIKFPCGTIIRDAESGKVICDLKKDGDSAIIARGGSGGWGNSHFATSTRQTPKFAKAGLKGDARDVTLELKLIADVGLLGFPNVGKSTFLSIVSDAKPKIANYHFTTLQPNLGVVNMGDGSFVIADIPGIIEGASEGVGLGHDFLRHVERTRVLLHFVDVSGCEARNPLEDFDTINTELEKYSPKLAEKPQIVVANKMDIPTFFDNFEAFKNELEGRGYKVFGISGATKQGVTEVLNYAYEMLSNLPAEEEEEYEYFDFEEVKRDDSFEVFVDNGVYVVEGDRIENLVNSTNFDDYESLQFFQRMLRKLGVISELEKAGINEGDPVYMYGVEFDFVK
ncbi:MAG: GTPase ObgE [Clostridia bacterium]|nr:GTPase ObgE [Clostridia bacterium]MBO5505420.1 GTPase ObgE [Clostridia bacterium]